MGCTTIPVFQSRTPLNKLELNRFQNAQKYRFKQISKPNFAPHPHRPTEHKSNENQIGTKRSTFFEKWSGFARQSLCASCLLNWIRLSFRCTCWPHLDSPGFDWNIGSDY